MILEEIIFYIKSNFQIEREELLLDGEKTFRVMLGEKKTVQPDFIMYGKKDGTTRYYMAVVEMKRSSPKKENKQNVIERRSKIGLRIMLHGYSFQRPEILAEKSAGKKMLGRRFRFQLNY